MQPALASVISEYASSPRICGLVEAWNAAIDPSANIDAFFNDIFNIDTAIGYGLDVLGRILGVGRTLDNITLSDTDYRNVLIAKAMANISNASIHSINLILIQLFGPSSPTPVVGNSYCTDPGGMAMTMTFGPPANFIGSIGGGGGNVLTAGSPNSGAILIGQQINGAGVAANTTVLAQISGTTGGAGTYQLTGAQVIGSEAMTSNSALSAEQLAIINFGGVIPKPVGVALTVVN